MQISGGYYIILLYCSLSSFLMQNQSKACGESHTKEEIKFLLLLKILKTPFAQNFVLPLFISVMHQNHSDHNVEVMQPTLHLSSTHSPNVNVPPPCKFSSQNQFCNLAKFQEMWYANLVYFKST